MTVKVKVEKNERHFILGGDKPFIEKRGTVDKSGKSAYLSSSQSKVQILPVPLNNTDKKNTDKE